MQQEVISALIRVLPFAAALVIIWIFIKKGKLSLADLAIEAPNSRLRLACWTIAFLVLVLLIEFLLWRAGLLEIDPWNHQGLSSFIRILGAVMLAPVTEELLFRGLVLTKWAKKNNKHLAIVAQAAFFVVLHNFAYQNTLTSNIGIIQSFTDAVLFGYARYHTRSIYTPMAMHATGNLIATLERFIL